MARPSPKPSTASAGARRSRSEGLSQGRELAGGDHVAVVGDHEPDACVRGGAADSQQTALAVVADRVVEQVGDEVAQQHAVPGHHRGLERELDVQAGLACAGRQLLEHLAARAGDVDRLVMLEAAVAAVAAERLGITAPGVNVWLGDRWFTVIGILGPVVLDPELDAAALIGYDVAAAVFRADRSPTEVYVRTDPERVEAVQRLLAATGNPEHPEETTVSRPSDALEARAAAKSAFTSLFLGLGAVALLVGGVGIANVMVISVLERRSEIGLRRALGATRRQIAAQFFAESLLLAALGGLAGSGLGALVTIGYAVSRDWIAVVPPVAVAAGLGAALAIGAVAGLYPAVRAARLAPTDALRTA